VGFVGSPVKVGMMLKCEEVLLVLPVAQAVLFAADVEPGGRAERERELEDMERRRKRKEQRRPQRG
jgi:hypothetical protein